MAVGVVRPAPALGADVERDEPGAPLRVGARGADVRLPVRRRAAPRARRYAPPARRRGALIRREAPPPSSRRRGRRPPRAGRPTSNLPVATPIAVQPASWAASMSSGVSPITKISVFGTSSPRNASPRWTAWRTMPGAREPGGRVGAEREPAHQVAARELGERGAVAVAGDQAEQVARAAELAQRLRHARQHLVALALGDRLGQVLEPALDELRQLVRRRLAPEHRLERLGADVRVGHAGVGVLADVGRDPVQLLERAPPRDGARAAGRDERAVDVEEEDAVCVGHGSDGARNVLRSTTGPRRGQPSPRRTRTTLPFAVRASPRSSRAATPCCVAAP